MRAIFLLFFIIKAGFCFCQDVFSFSVEKIEGQQYQLSSCLGKKILIVGFSTSSPNKNQLLMIDSLYQANSNRLAIIGLPLKDLGGAVADSTLNEVLKIQLGLNFIISKPVFGSRLSGDLQHPLAKWLTHVAENGHFSKDIKENGEMFMLSEKGRLFGVFGKSTPVAVINNALNRKAD